jgi:uncharacterized protein YndB with AHSA1/START domain
MAERLRGYAHRVDLQATPEAVWRALTDVRLTVHWYAPEMRIDGRAGGRYWVNVPGASERDAHIDVFDAPRRLRLIYLPGAALPAGEAVLVDDFLITPQAHITVLRLLGSGVPQTNIWDTFFVQCRLGWEQALRRFKLFLERQPAARGA